MSIEKLEEWERKYRENHSEWDNDGSDEWDNYYCIQQFMIQVINMFKEHNQ